jgi:hypothetical protein
MPYLIVDNFYLLRGNIIDNIIYYKPVNYKPKIDDKIVFQKISINMARIRKQTDLYSESHLMHFQKCRKYKLKSKNREYQDKSRNKKKLKKRMQPNKQSKKKTKK